MWISLEELHFPVLELRVVDRVGALVRELRLGYPHAPCGEPPEEWHGLRPGQLVVLVWEGTGHAGRIDTVSEGLVTVPVVSGSNALRALADFPLAARDNWMIRCCLRVDWT